MNVTGIAPTSRHVPHRLPRRADRCPTASNLNPTAGQTRRQPRRRAGRCRRRRCRFYNAAGQHPRRRRRPRVLPAPGVGAGYVALDPPTRDLDTRTGHRAARTARSAPNGTFKLKVARYDGVPADAAAVMLERRRRRADRQRLPHRVPRTAPRRRTRRTSTSAAGATTANAVLSPASAPTGAVAFHNAAGNTHVISDLAGYFIDPANVQLPPP